MAGANETLKAIVAEMRDYIEGCKENGYGAVMDEDDLIAFADRLDAAGWKAWVEVDEAVRWMEDVGEVDVGKVHEVMNRTLGEYDE